MQRFSLISVQMETKMGFINSQSLDTHVPRGPSAHCNPKVSYLSQRMIRRELPDIPTGLSNLSSDRPQIVNESRHASENWPPLLRMIL